VAAKNGLEILAEQALIVDVASAADPAFIERLVAADVVAFPGGDPDLIASVMRGSSAWAAIEQAHDAGGGAADVAGQPARAQLARAAHRRSAWRAWLDPAAAR